MPRLSSEKHLVRIREREKEARFARSRLVSAVRAAVRAGGAKTEIAEAASVSRATLYRILKEKT